MNDYLAEELALHLANTGFRSFDDEWEALGDDGYISEDAVEQAKWVR